MDNKAFFRNASHGQMTLKDIFSDVTKKHTSRDTARVFMAGTEFTTPDEANMLSGWMKPFFFARFLFFGVIFLLLCLLFAKMHIGGYFFLMIALSCIIPITLLLLVWEMNIPRNISLGFIILVVMMGGILSLIATMLLSKINPLTHAIWAPLTEEPAKLLIAAVIIYKKNYKFTLNGILIGVAVGTGFAIFENIFYTFSRFAMEGIISGLVQAVLRALTDIPGHGLYAGLYCGALVMVKGDQPLKAKHFFDPKFLMYFFIAFGLHMLNNSGFTSNIIVIVVVMTALIIVSFLPMLRKGVNQIVSYVVSLNNNHLTQAVSKDPRLMQMVSPAARSSAGTISVKVISGPCAGQRFSQSAGRDFTIGRSSQHSDIALKNLSAVSRRHLGVTVKQGRIFIMDLSSSGTYLNGQRIGYRQPVNIGSGAVLYLGNKECGIQISL